MAVEISEEIAEEIAIGISVEIAAEIAVRMALENLRTARRGGTLFAIGDVRAVLIDSDWYKNIE